MKRSVILSTRIQYSTQHTVFENRPKSAFNIASEASYVYILRGHKLVKNAKNGQFGEFLIN